jgi:hypothetical protein
MHLRRSAVLAALVLAACAAPVPGPAPAPAPQDAFWASLAAHCGSA